jgi:shikimate kinase
MGIIIFGASGAGSTTLGKEVAKRLNIQHFDIDDYLWRWDTEIPLTVTRSPQERTTRLMNAIRKRPCRFLLTSSRPISQSIKNYSNFVISGTIFNDRELFEPLLDLAVFVSTPAIVCAERVHAREHARWGERVRPGGDMYKVTRFHGDFDDYLENARRYETADVSKFSRKFHEQWMANLPCPTLCVDGIIDVCENADKILAQAIG